MTATPGPPRPAAGTRRIVVIGGDGQPVPAVIAPPATDAAAAEPADQGAEAAEGSDVVEQPAKVMRIGTMIKALLDEVKAAPLDEASRLRLREIHRRSITELEDGLSADLREELERLSLPFTDDGAPSDAELRIAQAQLVGWLEGLFHGIQTALFAQQMAAQAQLAEMRRHALPQGVGQPPGSQERTGQYL